MVNENCVASVIAALTQADSDATLMQTDSDAWCKRTLTVLFSSGTITVMYYYSGIFLHHHVFQYLCFQVFAI